MKRYYKIRRNIYIFVIVIELMQIFFPVVAYAADIFKNDVHDADPLGMMQGSVTPP